MTQDTKNPVDETFAYLDENKKPTRDELIAELMKRPPERRRVIIKLVQMIVAEKRLERAIKEGTATRN